MKTWKYCTSQNKLMKNKDNKKIQTTKNAIFSLLIPFQNVKR